jgi:hypothetical protein
MARYGMPLGTDYVRCLSTRLHGDRPSTPQPAHDPRAGRGGLADAADDALGSGVVDNDEDPLGHTFVTAPLT